MKNLKSHTAILTSSLVKIEKDLKTKGRFKNKKLYLLEIIYKLINKCNVQINQEQVKELSSLYNKIIFSSSEICKPSPNKFYNSFTDIKKFQQAEAEDCVDSETGVTYKVFYWQEENFQTIPSDIFNTLTLDTIQSKSFKSLKEFEEGVTLNFNNDFVGRINLFIIKATDSNYKVFDILNNEITDAFEINLKTSLKGTLLTTKNYYGNGDFYFKIKQI